MVKETFLHSRTHATLAHQAVALLASTAMALSCLWALPASAQTGTDANQAASARSIVVVDLATDDKEHTEIRREIWRAVSRHQNADGERDFLLQDLNAALNAGGEVDDLQNIATAKGFLDAGRAALAADDPEDALDQLTSAQQLFSQSYAVLSDSGQLGSTLLMLADAKLRTGDTAGANETFMRAAAFRVRPGTEQISAAGTAAYGKAIEATRSGKTGGIQINTDPAYAEVYVDGIFKGISPKAVAGLSMGQHVVTIFKPGFTRTTKMVTVDPKKLAHADVALVTARRKLLYDGAKQNLTAELAALKSGVQRGGKGVKELGGLFRAEAALIARIEGPPETKSLEFFLFHVPTQRLVSRHKVEGLDWSYQNREAIEKAVNTVLTVDWVEQLGGDTSTVTTDDGGVTSEWWFWTLIGVAVAGGATAAILASQGDESPPPFEKNDTGAMVLRF